MKKTTKRTIVSITEIILRLITIASCIALVLALVTMIESWSITKASLITAIVSTAWLGLIGTYTYLVNK